MDRPNIFPPRSTFRTATLQTTPTTGPSKLRRWGRATTMFGALAVCLLLAQPALAAPPTPINGVLYFCLSNAAGWNTVEFDLTPFGPNLLRGVIFVNGDNKKADLAFDASKNPYGWEFVMPLDNTWCNDLQVASHRLVLDFRQCNDGIRRICFR